MLSSCCFVAARPLGCFASLALPRLQIGRGQRQLNAAMTPQRVCTRINSATVRDAHMKAVGLGLQHANVMCDGSRIPVHSMAREQKLGYSKRCASVIAAAYVDRLVKPADSYKIAVPSYDRALTLKTRTLEALRAANVDISSRVDVFVANEQEAEQYRNILEPGTYSSIIVGTLGIGNQRDFILKHYGFGANVVMVDDDIEWFKHKYDGPVNMHNVIIKGFELCPQHMCYMWGINNSSNKFYMKPTYSVGWCFFQGPFMAFRVRDIMRLNRNFNQTREDVQYSLMHCAFDGQVLRINGVGLKARPYGKEPGGLQSHMTSAQRAEVEQANREYLMREYGDLIRSWPEDKPHPSMKRSRGHLVQPLQFQ